MKAHEALIAWTPANADSPTAGQVKIGPLIDEHSYDRTRPYFCTGGAAYTGRGELRGLESIVRMFQDFHAVVVAGGVDPQVAHRAFLAIDEYRENAFWNFEAEIARLQGR